MPAERLSMRQIREVLRLCYGSKLPQRAIARSLGLSQGAVSGYLSRARAAGIVWPLAEDIDDARLEALLFPPPSGTPADQRPMPDWGWVHRELRRADVTLALLWEEYRIGAVDGFSYSWFCDLYRAWAGRLKPTMRQIHLAGEKLFVDFAGRTGEVIDPRTGEIRPVQIFVAVLGASNFTYAAAVWSQKLPDWIAAHVHAFSYFGGAARQTVSDNLKAGIIKASFHEPMVNRQDSMRIGCSDQLVFKRAISAKEAIMETVNPISQAQPFVSEEAATLFVSLELSRARWLVTSLSPGGSKISRHFVAGGASKDLLQLLADLRMKAERHIAASVKIVTIQEIGFDGFWIHRILASNSIESHVVEAASIAVPRRRRRAKTDAIDGELLLRTLMAFKRGEPRVCAMVVVPSPDEEDQRRLSRERKTMIKERIEHINRIKGLMACQGIASFEPMRANAREKLGELRTGDGRAIPERMKAEIRRELDRLELLRRQIADVEAERDALLHAKEAPNGSPGAQLLKLRGIGPEFATVLWQEGLYRRFGNRRQLAAYAGLAPSPWRSGDMKREQGISKSGNARLRTTMIEAAWLWLRHQPGSALSQWFQERVRADRGRLRRVSIVAMARKLLIALWRFTLHGEIPEGASLKAA